MSPLFHEDKLPFCITKTSKFTIVGPVEKLLSGVVLRISLEIRHHVVAIQMDLER